MTPVAESSKGKVRASTAPDASEMETSATRYEDSMVVTGCADSTVRIWDARSGRCMHRITTDKVRGEQTLVWTTAVLADLTIVSGDSMGLVKFWDGKMGTQLQSIKAHKADVLAIVISPDGRSIYSSGVDQKVTQMQFVSVETKEGEERRPQDRARWVLTLQRRLHSHDVRALAISPSYELSSLTQNSSSYLSSQVPIVISGGLDFSLVFTPASTASTTFPLVNPVSDSDSTSFQESYHRKASFNPQRGGPISVAREEKLLICRREKTVDIWELREPNSKNSWQKVLEMDLKVGWPNGMLHIPADDDLLQTKTNLIASAISPDGSWIAVSDLHEIKAFKLRINVSLLLYRCSSF